MVIILKILVYRVKFSTHDLPFSNDYCDYYTIANPDNHSQQNIYDINYQIIMVKAIGSGEAGEALASPVLGLILIFPY